MEGEVEVAALEVLAQETGPPALVLHAAGPGTVAETFADPAQSFNDAVVSLSNLIEFLRRRSPDAVLIFPSSCAVYGEAKALPISEDAPVRPISPYGTHKAMGEELCTSAARDFGLRVGIIRYFSVYGPGLKKQLTWDICRRARDGERVIRLAGTGEESRDFLYIDDATNLVMAVAAYWADPTAEPDDVLVTNGGTGSALTTATIAQTVASLIPTDLRVEFTGHSRKGDPMHYEADIQVARLLGFVPERGPTDGIAEYCRWIIGQLWP